MLCAALVARAGTAPAQPRAPDRDGDGVVDARDACPDEVGLDPGGCPPRDRDADGVLDPADACPDRAGPTGNRGCPAPSPGLRPVTMEALRQALAALVSAALPGW